MPSNKNVVRYARLSDGRTVGVNAQNQIVREAKESVVPIRDSVWEESAARFTPEALASLALVGTTPTALGSLTLGGGSFIGRNAVDAVGQWLMDKSETSASSTKEMLMRKGYSDAEAQAFMNKHWDKNEAYEPAPTLFGGKFHADDFSFGKAYETLHGAAESLMPPGELSHFNAGEQKIVGGAKAAGAMAGTVGTIPRSVFGALLSGAGAMGLAAGASHENPEFDSMTPQQRVTASYNQGLLGSIAGSAVTGVGKYAFNRGKNNLADVLDKSKKALAGASKKQGDDVTASTGDKIEDYIKLTDEQLQEFADVGDAAKRLDLGDYMPKAAALGRTGEGTITQLFKANPPLVGPKAAEAVDVSQTAFNRVLNNLIQQKDLPKRWQEPAKALRSGEFGEKTSNLVKGINKRRAGLMKDFADEYDTLFKTAGKQSIVGTSGLTKIVRDPQFKKVANIDPEVEKSWRRVLMALRGTKSDPDPEISTAEVAKLVKNIRESWRRVEPGVMQQNRDRMNQLKFAANKLDDIIRKENPVFAEQMANLDKKYRKEIVDAFHPRNNPLMSQIRRSKAGGTGQVNLQPHQVVDALVHPSTGQINRKNYEAMRNSLDSKQLGELDNIVFGSVRNILSGTQAGNLQKALKWTRNNAWAYDDPAMQSRMMDMTEGAVGSMLNKVLRQNLQSKSAKDAIRSLMTNVDDAERYAEMIRKTFGQPGIDVVQQHMLASIRTSQRPYDYLIEHGESIAKFLSRDQIRIMDDVALIRQKLAEFDKLESMVPQGMEAALAGNTNVMQRMNNFLKRSIGIRFVNIFSAIRQALLRHQSGAVSMAYFSSRAGDTAMVRKAVDFLLNTTMSGKKLDMKQAEKVLDGAEVSAEYVQKFQDWLRSTSSGLNSTIAKQAAIVGPDPTTGGTRSEQMSEGESKVDQQWYRHRYGVPAQR